MDLNKKSFINIVQKIEKKKNINKLYLIIWHGASIEYKNAMYLELMFGVKESDGPICLRETEDEYLFYGETLEDRYINKKRIYKTAETLKKKITSWVKGSFLENVEIVIQEQNI